MTISRYGTKGLCCRTAINAQERGILLSQRRAGGLDETEYSDHIDYRTCFSSF